MTTAPPREAIAAEKATAADGGVWAGQGGTTDVRWVYAGLLLVQLLFGSLSVAGKIALREMTPLSLAFFRIASGAVVFIVWWRMLGARAIESRGDWARLFLYSMLGITLNQTMFLKGLSLTTAVNATVLATVIPVGVVAVALLLGHEGMTWRKGLGIAAGFGGALYLTGVERLDLTDQYVVGNLLCTGNSLLYAVYLVLSRPFTAKYGAITLVAGIFGFGALTLVPFVGAEAVGTLGRGLTGAAWLALLFIIVGPTLGTYGLNAWALKYVPSSVVAIFIYVQPMVAAALAAVLLGEALSPRAGLAAVLIGAGVYLVSTGGPKKAATGVTGVKKLS